MEKPLNTYLPDTSAPATQMAGQGMNHEAVYTLITLTDIQKISQPRKAFSHKGTYGHALLVAGTENTMGAALLCAKACLYGGAGLTTLSIPETGLSALNTSLPEVMYLPRISVTEMNSGEKYQAIAIGPGLGTDHIAIRLLKKMIDLKVPLVTDADALNILAENPSLMAVLPKDSILTPHVKEFDHLFGEHKTWYERIQTARKKAQERQIVIVLKNQYTFIIDHSGKVFINPTGNPGMAQGGMGDILTGLIAAYSAQGYKSIEAALLACFLHGKSGDELCKSSFNVTASQVAEYIPEIRLKIK